MSLSLLSLLVQKRCCLIKDIPRWTALANKVFSVGWTSCFSSAEMEPPPQTSLLALEEGKILTRTFRNACSLPELAMWNSTISDGKQTLLYHVREKKVFMGFSWKNTRGWFWQWNISANRLWALSEIRVRNRNRPWGAAGSPENLFCPKGFLIRQLHVVLTALTGWAAWTELLKGKIHIYFRSFLRKVYLRKFHLML